MYSTFFVSFLARNYGNIMHDKRVVRGNTYAVSSLPAVSFCLSFDGTAYEIV